MVTAHIYARQSMDRDEGIKRQIARCEGLIATREWTLGSVFIDNETSAFKERGPKTEWAKMLRTLKPGDYVVAVDLDRLLRSTRDLLALTDHGLVVVTVTGEMDLSTADGEMRASLAATLARFEVRKKSERQVRANDYRSSSGRPVPTRRRYGFETDGVTTREEEAVHVRALFNDFHSGASIRSLAIRMGWRTGRVREVLSNPMYSGRVKHRGQVYESEVMPEVVPRALAEEVVAMLADPMRKTTPGNTVKHMASGIALCGVCGSPMLYMRAYRCRKDSSHPSIIKPTLETRIAREVATALIWAPLSRWDGHEDVSGLRSALAGVRAAKQEWMDTKDAGVISQAEMVARLRPLAAKESDLIEQIDKAQARTSTTRILASLRGDLWSTGDVAHEDYNQAKAGIADAFLRLSIEEQRELIRAVIRVIVHPGRSADRIEVEHLLAFQNEEQRA